MKPPVRWIRRRDNFCLKACKSCDPPAGWDRYHDWSNMDMIYHNSPTIDGFLSGKHNQTHDAIFPHFFQLSMFHCLYQMVWMFPAWCPSRSKPAILAITHQLSMAKVADQVLVLEDGCVKDARCRCAAVNVKTAVSTRVFRSISSQNLPIVSCATVGLHRG